jgi:hypothetical protein
MSVSITKLGSDPNFQTVSTPTTVGPWPDNRDCPSANSAVSTKGVMYVSCDSDLGHKCMHLTYGYLFAGIGQVSNAAGRSHRGSSPSRTRAYVHAGSPGTWASCIPGFQDEGAEDEGALSTALRWQRDVRRWLATPVSASPTRAGSHSLQAPAWTANWLRKPELRPGSAGR